MVNGSVVLMPLLQMEVVRLPQYEKLQSAHAIRANHYTFLAYYRNFSRSHLQVEHNASLIPINLAFLAEHTAKIRRVSETAKSFTEKVFICPLDLHGVFYLSSCSDRGLCTSKIALCYVYDTPILQRIRKVTSNKRTPTSHLQVISKPSPSLEPSTQPKVLEYSG